ncbi:MAG: ABC transporter ATP-binding protein [Microbacteriaceae bacterium]|nr:ABC transporter ATP-binding protein [Microbacteriaceae bacterium]
MSSERAIVSVRRLHVRFGAKVAVNDLSFEVFRGETFGFLGSNGSGKTSTIRALLGICQPSEGAALVNGRVFTPADGSRLGYLPEERGLYKNEPVLEVMVYFGRLKGLSRVGARRRASEFLERVGLGAQAATRIGKLSGGQQQKIQLGVTIINNPELLILDEPTKGFDPVNRGLLMEIIAEQKRQGSTIVMVTHQMEEVEELCSRAIMLKEGRTATYGTIAEIKQRYQKNRDIDVRFGGFLPPSDLYSAAASGLNRATITMAPNSTAPQVLAELMAAGVAINSFTPLTISLNEVFLQVYGVPTDAPGAR